MKKKEFRNLVNSISEIPISLDFENNSALEYFEGHEVYVGEYTIYIDFYVSEFIEIENNPPSTNTLDFVVDIIKIDVLNNNGDFMKFTKIQSGILSDKIRNLIKSE